MGLEIITTEDLENFRIRLLADIETLLQKKPPKKWLKSQEVMEQLGISEVTLQTLRNRGKIPFRKLGGTCYYSMDEIDEYLQKSKYMTL